MRTTLTVHDCQLVDDIPIGKLLIHDVPVDIICTPTQVIFTHTSIPKPQGWWKISNFAFSSKDFFECVLNIFVFRNLLYKIVL
jgi:hypothetical protein